MMFEIKSKKKFDIIDLTSEVKGIIEKSKVKNGFVLVFVPHATAALAINEFSDYRVKEDFLRILEKIIPEHSDYKHDEIDNNAQAHLKAGLLKPFAVVPIESGNMVLGTWQRIGLCEFDGPRQRSILVDVYAKD